MSRPVPLSTLHHAILRHVVDFGFAPRVPTLAALLERPASEIEAGLERLHREHGVVLHPGSTKIWVAHPFSLTPTNFWVRAGERSWWGPCAWCSLGIAALVQQEVDDEIEIATTLGGHDEQVRLRIREGRVVGDRFLVHFPIPMRRAWDNVVYTCSTMLLFDSEDAIDAWCVRHDVRKGDVKPVSDVWNLAQVWYGQHLSPDWRKWTAAEAREIFKRFGFSGEIWALEASGSRF